MPLAAGTRLGPYEILAPLGAGGMGEVYRAKDTRLGRSVAVKVLPAHLTSDPEHRARFEREAKAVSSLNHPNICTLHDVGHEQGIDYLVMELVEGETLAERLKKGALPLEQLLRLGIEVADALDKAHRKGVIHRDLKPGNVMLTKAGSKLMDFGLAKRALDATAGDALSTLPTQTPLTGQGMLLGTLAYMSPEQLEGKEADARSDLWAFGCMLYEMATGRPAFQGKSQASLISAIMTTEPQPITQLQPLTPPALGRLVKVCLAKDPDNRLQTAHDVMQELKWIAEAPPGPSAADGVSLTHVPAGRRRWAFAAGALALLVVAFLGALAGWLLHRPKASTPAIVRTSLDVRPAQRLDTGFTSDGGWRPTLGGSRTAFAWTADGRALVFAGLREGGPRQLYVRELDHDGARPLAGTDGARTFALSPDGQWVAFWADGAIKRVALAGGPVSLVVSAVQVAPSGMAHGANGDVFYDLKSANDYSCSIWCASVDRAPARVTAQIDGEPQYLLPALLPGERALVYTVRKRDGSWGDEQIVVQILATGERRVLLQNAVDARYVPSGHLLYMRRGTLFAVAFDARRVEVRGSPVALVDQIAQALSAGNSFDITGAGQFSVAPTGTLAYVSGPVVPYPNGRLIAIDRRGRVTPLPGDMRSYSAFTEASPDGRRLAIATQDFGEAALWVDDIARGTLSRLTPEGEAGFPRWTPDGQRVAFGWLTGGRHQLAWQRADGTAPPEVLAQGEWSPSSWSPDGRRLALVKDDDIWVAKIEESRASVERTTATPQRENWPEFSPDGRWMAYGSDVSGRFEVYVRPWPGPGPSEQVSTDGGESPAWNPAGRELFFVSPGSAGKGRMMAVDVSTGPTLSFGKPRPVFEFSEDEMGLWCTLVRCYGVAPDGQRLFTTKYLPTTATPPVTHIQLVQNWTEELKARLAAGQAK